MKKYSSIIIINIRRSSAIYVFLDSPANIQFISTISLVHCKYAAFITNKNERTNEYCTIYY